PRHDASSRSRGWSASPPPCPPAYPPVRIFPSVPGRRQVGQRLAVRQDVGLDGRVRTGDVALLEAQLLEHDVPSLRDGGSLVVGDRPVAALAAEAAVR